MTVKIDTTAEINSIRMKEQGSNPSTPVSGYWQLYAKPNGIFALDDGGNIYGPFITGTYANIGARVYSNQNPTNITSGDSVPFNSERWDTDSIHETGTNNTRLTCNTPGVYLIHAQIAFPGKASGYNQLLLQITGSTNIAVCRQNVVASSQPSYIEIGTMYNLQAGQWITVIATYSGGGSLALPTDGAQYTPEFMMQKIG